MKRGLSYLVGVWLLLGINGFIFELSGQLISGKITDEKGNPLPGTAITIENTFLGTASDPGGNYQLKLLHDGRYRVKYSFVGYGTVLREVNVNGVLSVDITLIPSEIMTEEIIVNGTRAGNKTPLTYTNVNSEKINRNNNGQDIPYLIGMTPSLVETSETGTGIGYTGLRIRGTDGSRINVTLDGIPMNDAESQQVFWVDLPDLASSVDNIQVQRGVGTSSNGSGAFGASLNIQSKSLENLPFAEMSSTFGSFNTFKNTIAAGTGLLADKFAFQLRLSDLRSDGYIERTGVENRSAYLSGVYRTGRSRLKANLILGQEHTGISWWGVPKEMLTVNRRYNPAGEYTDEDGTVRHYQNESDNYKQNHFQLIYSLNINKYTFLNTAFHFTTGKGYYEEYAEDQTLSDYGLDPVTVGGSEITSTDLIRQKWLSNKFYGLVYSLNYKKERIDAVFGGALNLYDGNHFGNIIWMRNAGNTEKDWQWYLNKARKTEVSVYGKVNYRISDRLNGYGDLNWRMISYNMEGPDDDLRYLLQDHSYDFLNPKAGLFYTISPRQDAYLSFSVAHKEPTRSDFKEASGDEASTPLPESLFDTEAGYNIKNEKVALGVNLYGMMYKDQLVPTGQLSNVGYPIMTNVKNSYRSGVELSAGFKPVNLIDLQFNITVSRNKILDYTEYYTDYISADDSYLYKSKSLGDVDIAYSPSVIGSGEIIMNFSEIFRMHLITKYVGKQYFDNTMSTDRMMDPYLVNNLVFDVNPTIRGIKRVDIQLFVNNVLNVSYENNAYGGSWYEDGTENTWSYYFPQAGISFLLKLGVKF